VHESPADTEALQELLDRSYATAGAHLLKIHTPDRRLGAEQVIERLSGEEFAVTVHGRAVPVDVRAGQEAGFRQTLLEIYQPRYGSQWEEFLDSGPVYARIEADRMFALAIPSARLTG